MAAEASESRRSGSFQGEGGEMSRRHTVLALLALLAAALLLIPSADSAGNPSSVTIAGSLQSELGCPGDWQPDCAATHLAYDAADDVWQGSFTVPAGSWEYKAPSTTAGTRTTGCTRSRTGRTSRSIPAPTARSSSTTTTRATG